MDDQGTMNVLRGLIIDGVHQANSGHPGGPLSSLDFAYVLFTEFLNFDPKDPGWMGRDRFILSAGHESMLLYALLHMNGTLPLDELRRFRQLHSQTPGHPENYVTPGVECTTGPLGQGAAMSVGFAVAAQHLSATLGPELFGHKTYVVLGDGCMQEDVTLGAASLAGHLKLPNLVWYYDKNRAQISGTIDRATSDDEAMIFRGMGWQVANIDGHDTDAIRQSLKQAQSAEQPLLIIGETVMAKGVATMEGSHKTHGAPLPNDERLATKKKLGLPEGEDFYVDPAAKDHYQRNFVAKSNNAKQWQQTLNQKLESDASFKQAYDQYFAAQDFRALPSPAWPLDKPLATRNAFGDLIELWADQVANLMGGSADLEPSNMTGAFAKKVRDFCRTDFKGRNLAFGVREFPMSAICNGMALHGGIIPFDATFLTFSDYARAALRLGAIQQVRVIHEYTHDSFYLGEDGPTHQAVEHAMSLRLMPNFYLMRPADAYETEIMLKEALATPDTPSALCLSRQKLAMLPIDAATRQQAKRGGYAVQGPDDADIIILATGSEVNLALAVAASYGKDAVRVVSLPCWEIFEAQDQAYRDSVLCPHIKKRVSIEAGVTLGWQKYTGHDGLNIGLDRYGDSAPYQDLEKEYGFTVEAVVQKIKDKW